MHLSKQTNEKLSISTFTSLKLLQEIFVCDCE